MTISDDGETPSDSSDFLPAGKHEYQKTGERKTDLNTHRPKQLQILKHSQK